MFYYCIGFTILNTIDLIGVFFPNFSLSWVECFDIRITREPETWKICITCTKDKLPSMLDLKKLFGVEISSFVDFLQESVEEDSEGNEEDLGGPFSGCKIENDSGYGGIGILTTTTQNKHYTRLRLVSFTLSENLAKSRVHGSRYPARKTIQ